MNGGNERLWSLYLKSTFYTFKKEGGKEIGGSGRVIHCAAEYMLTALNESLSSSRFAVFGPTAHKD